MKPLIKKVAAIILLAIYAIEPVHLVTHCLDKDHCSDCSVSVEDQQINNFSHKMTEGHTCFLCHNNQDKTHYSGKQDGVSVKQFLNTVLAVACYESVHLAQKTLFVESRGPPQGL